MPSQEHELLALLFRNRPELAPELLRSALHVELPDYSEVRLESAELNEVVPTEYRADLVVLLVDGWPVLGIVVEVQLSKVARKRFVWPAYVMGLRARLECPCCLLVITPSTAMAQWARQPIITGPGSQLIPHVIGPEGVPIVTDSEQAKRDPELAVLSVMAHGRGDAETAVKIALTALEATAELPEDLRVLYSDVIDDALGEAARKAFEMLPEGYKFKGPTFQKGKLEGRLAGLHEGRLKGQADAVLAVLDARGIDVSAAVRERILAATQLDELQHWLRRAAVIQNADELFEG